MPFGFVKKVISGAADVVGGVLGGAKDAVFGSKSDQTVQRTESEKALAEVNVKRFNRYLRLYRPHQRRHLMDLVSQTSPGEAEVLNREAVAGVRFNAAPHLGLSNISAGAGRLLSHHLAHGRSSGLANVNAMTMHEERRGGALSSVVESAIGRETQGIQGLTRGAQASATYERTRAWAELQEDMARAEAVGKILGSAGRKGWSKAKEWWNER